MATYYWVGGSGNWNSTNTANWSTGSGGSGGAGPPVSGDDVVFDAGSDSGSSFTVTVVATGPTIRNLTISGLDQAMIIAGSTTLVIQGNISLPASNLTWSATSSLSLTGSASSRTISTNGVSIAGNIAFNSVGSDWTLQSALTMSASFILTNGSFDTAGYAVTSVSPQASGTAARTLTLGSSTVTCTNLWNLGSNTNLTVSAASSTIIMTRATAKTFTGGDFTYGTLVQAGAGALTIAGSNSFADIQNSYKSTGATTITLTAGTTQTVTAFTASGESGRVLTLNSSSAGSAATLSKSSGSVTVAYLSIRDSTATGGATWTANVSTSVSGNTGWVINAGYVMVADVGSYALNGQSASVRAARRVAAGLGSYALTGQAATVRTGRKVAADYGSFALNGQAATLAYHRNMISAYGSFTLTGQDDALRVNRRLGADVGSYSLDGQNAWLINSAGYRMTADAGSYSLNGQDVGYTITQFWAVVDVTPATWVVQ